MENIEVSPDRLEEVSSQVDHEFELYWNWGCEDERKRYEELMATNDLQAIAEAEELKTATVAESIDHFIYYLPWDEKKAGRVNFWRAYEGDKWNKTHRELGYEASRYSDFDLDQTPAQKLAVIRDAIQAEDLDISEMERLSLENKNGRPAALNKYVIPLFKRLRAVGYNNKDLGADLLVGAVSQST